MLRLVYGNNMVSNEMGKIPIFNVVSCIENEIMKFENGEPANFPVYSGNATTD